jgi:hypothetical protein
MTTEQLLTLIRSDAQALALATAGSDDAAARRASEIAPKALTGKLWSYRGLSAVVSLDTLENLINSVDGHIASGGQYSGVVREMREYLRQDGLDISDPKTLGMLQAWAASPLPLTADDVAAIIEAASERPTISSVDITNLGLFNPGAE